MYTQEELERIIDLELEIKGEITEDDFAGPNSKLVKLISEDGTEFQVKRKHAILSHTIKLMLECPGEFIENQTNTITLSNVLTDVLKLVLRYLAYKYYFSTRQYTGILPKFTFPYELSLSLLVAASYLGC